MDQGPDVSHRRGLSLQGKLRLAQWIRYAPLRWLLRLAITIVVPRHRIGVAIVLRDERGRILMLRHVFHPITPWGLPGGWLNRHEEPRAGVLRELWEETGLQAELGPLVFTDYETRPRRIEMAFSGTVIPGPITLSSEIIAAHWFEPAALPKEMQKHTARAIAAALTYSQTL